MEWEDYHGMTDKNKRNARGGCSHILSPYQTFMVNCDLAMGHAGYHKGEHQGNVYTWPIGGSWMGSPVQAHTPELDKALVREGGETINTVRERQIERDTWVGAPASASPTSPASHAHPSGATSSHLAPVFTHLPRTFLQRVAARFLVGDRQHGRGNWHRSWRVDEQRFATWNKGEGSLTRPAWTVDLDFLRDRYNHAVEHLLAMRDEGNGKDDHLGAVAWFLAIAAEFEEATGLDWGELLRVTTPEAEVELRQKLNCPTGKGASAPAPTPIPTPVPPPTPPPTPPPPIPAPIPTVCVPHFCDCGGIMEIGCVDGGLLWECRKCHTTDRVQAWDVAPRPGRTPVTCLCRCGGEMDVGYGEDGHVVGKCRKCGAVDAVGPQYLYRSTQPEREP